MTTSTPTRPPLAEHLPPSLADRTQAAASVCRLSAILPPPDAPAAGFADLAALHAAASGGRDPVLYRAWRDVLPPRQVPGSGPWYADLVIYEPGTLPDRQPHRSTGHWNAPGQLEVFQVLAGTVVMLFGTEEDDGFQVAGKICPPGAVAAVPLGAWHVTFCLDGPAAVFNIYTDLPDDHGDGAGRRAALDPSIKYHRRPGPDVCVATGLCGWLLLGADRPCHHLKDLPDWNGTMPDGIGDLHALFERGEDTQLALLSEHAQRTWRDFRPSAAFTPATHNSPES